MMAYDTHTTIARSHAVPDHTGEQAGNGPRAEDTARRASGTGRPSGGAGRLERRLSWLYWAGAAGLAPWIVYLYQTQVPRAPTHQVHLLALGLLLTAIASLLATAWLSSRNHALAVIAASFAGTVTFISAWFRSLTRTAGSGMAESVPAFLAVVIVVVVLCGYVVRCELGSAARRRASLPRWLPLALVLAAAALVPSLVISLALAPAVQIAHHLRIAWTGLDIFEGIALAATGLALRRSSQAVLVPATVTAALLLCDAWINVIPARGAARAEGIALAFLEVPLAVLSLWVAVRAASGEKAKP
jgi:hypothetical protein